MKNGTAVGIIGGFGGMGRLFSGVFERAGYEVICSGRKTPVSNADIAKMCDIVIVSVPIHDTVRIIDEIAPLLKKEQLLCDFTSIKTAPVSAMLKSEAKVIGLHPMFGPSVSGISGQTIAATPVRCDETTQESLFDIFRNEGATVCTMTPQEHDRIMGVVQGLVHFATLSVAETIKNTGIPLESLISVMSPVYRIEMGLIGRILGQNASLYADILQMNPEAEKVIGEFSNSVRTLGKIVSSKDNESFSDFFKSNSEAFRAYIPQATNDTDLLIEAMVKGK
ncbi:MAG: prephenate dehydrogenase/arogenate dehydrogenase family protein [Methanomicrobiaceae archaeon]|nr:prephenate dehydrogenase/arogenate dehydrogenase family protein [Methanomicrobiaceae archaeon]